MIIVICPDGDVRHAEPFTSREDAETWIPLCGDCPGGQHRILDLAALGEAASMLLRWLYPFVAIASILAPLDVPVG